MFFWTSGMLHTITVETKPNSKMFVSKNSVTNDDKPQMVGANLNVEGQLIWDDTDVNVLWAPIQFSPRESQIHIFPQGQFSIPPQAAGKTWGKSVDGCLSVLNEGKVTLNVPNSSAKIVGNYINAGSDVHQGLTKLDHGTLQITGTYEQTTPTAQTALYHNSRLQMTDPQGIVGIRDGQLIGWGYIDCYELSVGFDPGQPGYHATNPCIMPGDMNGIGTLYVNASQRMRMFSGELDMEIAGPGAVGGVYQYDRILVTGDAWLGWQARGLPSGVRPRRSTPLTEFPVLTYRTAL